MSFGLDKCVVLEIKKERKVDSTQLELFNGKSRNEVDFNGYKYLEVVQMDKTLNGRIKSRIRKDL